MVLILPESVAGDASVENEAVFFPVFPGLVLKLGEFDPLVFFMIVIREVFRQFRGNIGSFQVSVLVNDNTVFGQFGNASLEEEIFELG